MNRWSRLGSFALIIGALGHFVIVDLGVTISKASYVRVYPDSFLNQVRSAVIDWGWLGRNNFSYIFAGFSLWLVLSLIFIGIYNLLIFRNLPPRHKLRLQSLVLGLTLSSVFLVFAIVCFIYPAVIGGALAVVCFGLGIWKEKQLQRASSSI